MTPWQIFGVFLDFLGIDFLFMLFVAKHSLDETPLHFQSESRTAEIESSSITECMQVIDDSFGYNVTYRIPAGSWHEIRERASSSVSLFRSRGNSMTLSTLLEGRRSLVSQYDITLRLALEDLIHTDLYGNSPAVLNFPPYVHAQHDIETWAKRGLGSRVTQIRSVFCHGEKWEGDEDSSRPTYLLLMFNLNPANISRLADRGPEARSPEVSEWKELWGDRSELRRFKDGSILYTNCMDKLFLINSVDLSSR